MAAPSSPSSPALRASDADRERVAEVLRRHHVDGRLDTDELQERLGACYAARTFGELEPLLADLPGERAPTPPQRRDAPPRGRAWAWPAPAIAAVVVVALTFATLGAIAHGRPGPLPFVAVFLLLRLAWWGPRRRAAWGPRG